MQPNSPTPSSNQSSEKPILIVHMSSPDKIIFEGQAEAITSVNERGEFDLLPLHENFITIVKTKAIIHLKIHGDKKEFQIGSGVIKIQKNKVYILIGFEALGDEDLVPQNSPSQEKIPISSNTPA